MVTDAKDTLSPKSSSKEVQCSHSGCDEPKLQEAALLSPTPLTTPKSARVGIFNAEDFLSRAQLNDKINNILALSDKLLKRGPNALLIDDTRRMVACWGWARIGSMSG